MSDTAEDLRASARRYADEFTAPEDLVEAALARLSWRKRHGFRVCPICTEAKPVAAFGQDASRRDGLEVRCRECRRTS